MRAVCVLLLLLIAPFANSNTLFQVVSLDCQYCAQFSDSGAEQRVIDFATKNGVVPKVGAFGPVTQHSRVLPEHPVLAFWASVRLNPSKAYEYTDVLYRLYSETQNGKEKVSRSNLIDLLAIEGELDVEELDKEARTNPNAHLMMWSKTARIAQMGMEYGNAEQLNTPAFVLLDESGVAGYVEWQGSPGETESAVKKMIKKLGE